MATIDTLQDAVNTLTSSTTELLDEVQVNKSTLTDSATSASNSATNAASSASSASSSASSASSSASAAASSASDAASSAASANAVVQGTAAVRHSVRPSLLLDFANSKTLDPRITFSRSSAGTYYDGKTTVKAEENLLKYSQELDRTSNWTQARSTVTANAATAPDGTTTADALLQATGQTTVGELNQSVSLSAGDHVVSIYAKANGKDWLRFYENINSQSTYFDLTNGVVGTTGASHTASIVSVGNGWYRCSIVLPVSSAITKTFFFQCATADNSTVTTDDGQGLYLWGAQVEQRSGETAYVNGYTPTTSQPITNYIPVLQTAAANTARFDHDPVTGESKGLLIEESRTNLLSESEAFNNTSYWAALNSNISYGSQAQIISPDGALTSRKFRVNANSAGATRLQHSYSVALGTSYTLSMYLKYGGQRYVSLCFYTSVGSSAGAGFDLVDNVVTATGGSGSDYTASNAKMEHVGNDWYRCSVTVFAAVSESTAFTLYARDNAYTSSTGTHYSQATGDGYGYKGVYVWGAQLETGKFPTSYIATSGAQATRGRDSVDIANTSSFTKVGEGSIYTEFKTQRPSTTQYVWNFIDTATSIGWVGLRIDTTGKLSNPLNIGNATVAEGLFNGYLTEGVDQNYKNVVAYKVNDYGMSADGQATQTDSNCLVKDFNNLRIGHWNYNNYYNGTIKKIAYYPTRLSNAELQAITED